MNKFVLGLLILGSLTIVQGTIVPVGTACDATDNFCNQTLGHYCDGTCKHGALGDGATCSSTGQTDENSYCGDGFFCREVACQTDQPALYSTITACDETNDANRCPIGSFCPTGGPTDCSIYGTSTSACEPTSNKIEKHCNGDQECVTIPVEGGTSGTCTTIVGTISGSDLINKKCVVASTSRDKTEKCPKQYYCKEESDIELNRCSQFGTQLAVDDVCNHEDSFDKTKFCGHEFKCDSGKCAKVTGTAIVGEDCENPSRTPAKLCKPDLSCDGSTKKCVAKNTPSAAIDATCVKGETVDGTKICVADSTCTEKNSKWTCVKDEKAPAPSGGSTSGDGTASTSSSSSSSNSNIVSFGVIAILGFVAFLI